MADANEEVKLRHEEFKIWKKNTPFLYGERDLALAVGYLSEQWLFVGCVDLVISHACEWPSLTVQWLPGYDTIPDKESTIHKLLLGTHTSNKMPNALIIANVLMPNPTSSECTLESLTDDLVSFGALSRASNRIKSVKVIAHDGEVNRARCNPFNKEIVATKTVNGKVFVFDTGKQPDRTSDSRCTPDINLQGHTQEGYGLSWNSFKDGLLLSGSDDRLICVWDINQRPSDDKSLRPLSSYEEHKKTVMDVAWNPDNGNLFGSVSDDHFLNLYDSRLPPQQVVTGRMEVHNSEINALSFNPVNDTLLATGAGDKTVALVDTRNLTQPLHMLEGHNAEIYMVSWNPTRDSLLGSCGADRRAMIWDISRIGMPQAEEEKEDGPPELLFVHGGHTSPVLDFSWNSDVDQGTVVATTSEDNILQVWQMAESIYEDKTTPP